MNETKHNFDRQVRLRDKLYNIRKALKKNIPFLIHEYPNYFRRTDYVEGDTDIGKNVKLFYWRMYEDFSLYDSNSENLGDYLSLIVVKNYVPVNSNENNTNRKKKTLYAIGSILGFRIQNAIVWGSGIVKNDYQYKKRIKWSNLDIRAVRGPKTREVLRKMGKSCPEIYGDPAILMPLIFYPNNINKKYDVSLVLHHTVNDFSIPNRKQINLINIITKDYESFVTQILESKLIISSSLHGIILAESYGVPAVLLLHEGQTTFKYEDWYYSTGVTMLLLHIMLKKH